MGRGLTTYYVRTRADSFAGGISLPGVDARVEGPSTGDSVVELTHDARGPRELAFRAAMPVNLRPLEEMAAMGNRFGLVFLDLPVGIADPRARFDAMRRTSLALRRTAEPLVVHGLLSFAGRSPMALQRLLVAIFGSKATAVFTNVPGPRSRLFFAGQPLSDIYFWVPQAGGYVDADSGLS